MNPRIEGTAGPLAIAALFTGSNILAEVIEGGAGAASALKMCYAAFTKGTTALLAAVRALAEQSSCLSFAQAFSMGFRSGEYGGR